MIEILRIIDSRIDDTLCQYPHLHSPNAKPHTHARLSKVRMHFVRFVSGILPLAAVPWDHVLVYASALISKTIESFGNGRYYSIYPEKRFIVRSSKWMCVRVAVDGCLWRKRHSRLACCFVSWAWPFQYVRSRQHMLIESIQNGRKPKRRRKNQNARTTTTAKHRLCKTVQCTTWQWK